MLWFFPIFFCLCSVIFLIIFFCCLLLFLCCLLPLWLGLSFTSSVTLFSFCFSCCFFLAFLLFPKYCKSVELISNIGRSRRLYFQFGWTNIQCFLNINEDYKFIHLELFKMLPLLWHLDNLDVTEMVIIKKYPNYVTSDDRTENPGPHYSLIAKYIQSGSFWRQGTFHKERWWKIISPPQVSLENQSACSA